MSDVQAPIHGNTPNDTPGRGNALQQLQTLFSYSAWARDKLLGAVEQLGDDQIQSGEHKGVYGSIHNTLAHLAVSEWLWLQRCIGESPMRLPTGEDFADLRGITAWWNTVHSDATRYLQSITEEDLAQQITYVAPDGKRRTRRVWHMLLQVTNHQTEHRAQIATMLGALGVEVPQTDLVVYLSEQA